LFEVAIELLVVHQRTNCPWPRSILPEIESRFAVAWVVFWMTCWLLSRMPFAFLSRSAISSGCWLAMVSLFRTLGEPAEPNEIAKYWLPNMPSVSIVATESCLMISCRFAEIHHHRDLFARFVRNSMLCTTPLWTPPTRTSAPTSNPATLLNCAFTDRSS